MPVLSILRHHRAAGSPADGTHRWWVELRDMRRLEVQLPPEERTTLELGDDELHDLLPTALERYVEAEGEHDIPWDVPVRLYADHFRG
jgi:hypothetical protein